jgi:hypothetical protein
MVRYRILLGGGGREVGAAFSLTYLPPSKYLLQCKPESTPAPAAGLGAATSSSASPPGGPDHLSWPEPRRVNPDEDPEVSEMDLDIAITIAPPPGPASGGGNFEDAEEEQEDYEDYDEEDDMEIMAIKPEPGEEGMGRDPGGYAVGLRGGYAPGPRGGVVEAKVGTTGEEAARQALLANLYEHATNGSHC